VARAAADGGKPVRGNDVLTSAERDDLARLRRRVRQIDQERYILEKATAWFAGKDAKTSIGSTNS
jgi:transposase